MIWVMYLTGPDERVVIVEAETGEEAMQKAEDAANASLSPDVSVLYQAHHVHQKLS